MRVLILVEACGGVARHVSDLCAALKDRGADVHLLYSPLREDAVLRAGLQRLAALAVPLKAVPMWPAPGLADLQAWRTICRYLKEHGPFDIIHGHSSKAGALARLALGSGRAVRIYTPHAFVTMNPEIGVLRRSFYRGLEQALAMLGDAVIATSPTEREHARSVLGIPASKLFLVPNGVAPPPVGAGTERQELRRSWGIGDEQVAIGTVARFVPQKHPELLLRAFAGVVHEQPQARLIMVGDGPLRRQLEQAAAELGIVREVVFPGFLDGGRVMAAFDVFALSSRYEGFPYVLLDALVTGLPIVTTAVGGAEMVVSEAANGYVVPVDGEQELAERLARLVASPTERSLMREASLARGQVFSVEGMASATLAVYQALLDQTRARWGPLRF